MAEAVHFFAKAAGSDIKGISTQVSLGREGSIECLEYHDAVRTAREKGSGMASGRRTWEPIWFLSRMGPDSPLLMKALCNNEVVEGVFKFYRPAPEGDGTTVHSFSIAISDARISAIERESPNVLDPASQHSPPTQKVSIVFGEITFTDELASTSHHDSWKDQV